jgi:hypothetical protein
MPICGAPRSPATRAPCSITIDSVAETFPATAPRTITRLAEMSLRIRPLSLMRSSPPRVMLPSTWP